MKTKSCDKTKGLILNPVDTPERIAIWIALRELKKETEGLVIHPDGTTKKVALKKTGKARLKQMQEIVGGGIEMYVDFYGGNLPTSGIKIVLNEEGRLIRLPYNRPASQIIGLQVVGTVLVIAQKTDKAMEALQRENEQELQWN